MKDNVEARTTFESVICNDPIMLLKVVKENLLCFEDSRQEMAKISNTIRNFINCRKKYKEDLLECSW